MTYTVYKNAWLNGVNLAEFGLITQTGYSVSYEFITGGNEGRKADGSYREDEIARKATVVFPVPPLDETALEALMARVYLSSDSKLRYYDPVAGADTMIRTLRGQLSPAVYLGRGTDGVDYWQTGTLTLVEA